MRRALLIVASTLLVYSGLSWAGPVGGGSGPITVDSTTFVTGSSVMGTDGGVFNDGMPPVGSSTTAAYRMTKYRAEHVNLRDTSGAALGVSGNPLYMVGVTSVTISSVTIGAVTVTNSSFSVTGSTVSVSNTGFNVNNQPSVHFLDALPAGTNNIGTVTGSTVTVGNAVAISGTPNVSVTNTPTVTANAGSGKFNVTGSTINVGGSVTIGNSPSVTAWESVNNGAGFPTYVGWNTTGSSVPVHEAGTANVNVTNSPLRVSASISGSSNTVSVSGTVPVSMVNVATVTLTGGSVNANVVNVTTTTITGTPTVNANSINVSTVTFAGSAQPVTQSGSWNVNNTSVNVGTVTVSGTPSVAQSGTWAVGVSAGSNVMGKVNLATPTTTVFSSSTINFSASGDNAVVAASSLKTVRVFRLFFVASAATTVTIKDGVSGAALTGPMTFNAGGAYILDFDGDPWFVTASGNAFVISQSGTAQISGRVYFTQS